MGTERRRGSVSGCQAVKFAPTRVSPARQAASAMLPDLGGSRSPRVRCGGRCGRVRSGGAGQLNEVAAGVVEHGRDHRPHRCRLLGERDASAR
jgi:hypothetical protein